MQNPAHSPRIDQLLEQQAWIRRLARSLAGDAQRADDLMQETWVRALEHPPEADGPIRGWIATVMRNLAVQTQRGDGRRRAREETIAREERTDSSHEVVERAALHRDLVEVVMSLDEPYRTTVLLRYYDGLAPSEIATRTQTKLATVKSRLSRGLDQLREHLDRRSGGDRSAWLSALAPLLRGPELVLPGPSGASTGAAAGGTPATSAVAASPTIASATAASLGALVMNVKFLSLIAIVATASVAFLVTRQPDTVEPVVVAAVETPAEDATSDPGAAAVSTVQPSVAERTRREDATQAVEALEATETVAPTRSAFTVQGQVLDLHSLPVGGVKLAHLGYSGSGNMEERPGHGEAVADGAGHYRFETQPGGAVVVDDDRYATVLSATGGEEPSVIVVAPKIELAGRVIDEGGQPLAGVNVRIETPPGMRARIDAILDRSRDVTFECTTDDAGSFAIAEAPAIEGARLLAGREGFASIDDPAPQQSLFGMTLVLSRPETSAQMLRGQVVDGNGRPLADVRVGHGLDTRLTDERGLFAFDLQAAVSHNRSWREMAARYLGEDSVPPPPATLVAAKPGYMPITAEARGRDDEGNALWPDHVTLRLDREALSIEGRVVDIDGVPLPGTQVWIVDPTMLGSFGDPGAGGRSGFVYTETFLAGSEDGWFSVWTDDEGRFEVTGLFDRDYTLQAMDPRTLLRTELEGVPAGEPVEIVLPTDALFERLRGRVVSFAGRPVEGVSLRPMNDAFVYKNAGVTMGTQHATAREKLVETDAEGRFEITEVPRRLAYLRLEGENTIPLEWGRRVEGGLAELIDDPDEIVITVGVRCHFQVELDGPDVADTIAVLDPEGRDLTISEFIGNGRRDGPRAELIDGLSPTLAVGDNARTLVLYKDDVEVDRLEIELHPAEKTMLRP